MKSNNEIVNNLLERRDKYETEKRNKKIKLTRTLTPICCACLVALIGIGAYYNVHNPQNMPVENSGIQQETTSKAYFYNNFAATVDPNADAYGEDELPTVSIVVSGNYYYQLDSSDHPAHNISSIIKDSDFGDYIGKITELFEHDDPAKYTASSKEPNLSGADVYYYAPIDSSAVIIVKKGQQCSIFVFNGMAAATEGSSVFADTFRIYGANSAEDIDNISFTVAVPDGSVFKFAAEGTITDREKINTVADVLFQLKPEIITDTMSGSPDWLNNAWDEYRANPNAFIREDIMFDITFKNGTVLKDISYQPYLGNGYIAGMQELTPDENAKLSQVFK